MRLRALQRSIEVLYDVALGYEADEFVCDTDTARALAGDEVIDRREALLVVEHEGDVQIGLFLDDAALDCADDPSAWTGPTPRFQGACLAAEGVSHLVYLKFRSDHEEPVRELELELQAEVDKYAIGLLSGFGVGVLKERSRLLRKRLFDDAAFLDDEETERGQRYREAHRRAARYAASLEARFVDRGALADLEVELKRFYRLGLEEKLKRTDG